MPRCQENGRFLSLFDLAEEGESVSDGKLLGGNGGDILVGIFSFFSIGCLDFLTSRSRFRLISKVKEPGIGGLDIYRACIGKILISNF